MKTEVADAAAHLVFSASGRLFLPTVEVCGQRQEQIGFRWQTLISRTERLGKWELLYHPIFCGVEFGTAKSKADSHRLVLFAAA